MTASEHHRRIPERPFLELERADVAVLFGTLTPKDEAFVRGVVPGTGYKCESLPLPVRRIHDRGRESRNNGLCDHNYFTAGALSEYLQDRIRAGLSVEEVVRRYVHFTARGCGSCRFSMYEGECRQALDNADVHGFRIITFESSRAIQHGSEHSGLRYTVNFGVGTFNALNLGDVLFDLTYQIRPYEVRRGELDRIMAERVGDVATVLETHRHFELMERVPAWVARTLLRRLAVKSWARITAKVRQHLYGTDDLASLDCIGERLDSIEIDRTSVMPVAKITGEFFSAFSEGDANYNLFALLENEGAEVWVESLVSLIHYWLHQAPLHTRRRRGLKRESEYWAKELLFSGSIEFWSRQYKRVRCQLGQLPQELAPQHELSRLNAPRYDPLTRGGEGNLEVAKAMYYSPLRKAHLLVSVKPVGCMPSPQSDGVMASVCAQHPDPLFLAVETSAEGEVHAWSCVQMALGDACRRARAEFARY